MDGSTESWKSVNMTVHGLKVTAAFEKNRNIPLVFVLHSDNKEYTFLNFSHSLTKPEVKGPEPTNMRGDYVFFVDNNYTGPMSSTFGVISPLNTKLDVRAAITLPNGLVFIGSNKYCILDLNSKRYEKKVFILISQTNCNNLVINLVHNNEHHI